MRDKSQISDEMRGTIESLIDAKRGRTAFTTDGFAQTMPKPIYERLIAEAKTYPSPETDLEAKILRAAIEAAARMEGFHGPLQTTLEQRLCRLFALIGEGNLEIIFPSL